MIGRKDANHVEAARRLEQAERDLAAAEFNQRSGFHEWACFQAQQAAEKALKSFLYLSGERAVIGHSINDLLQRCAELEPGFAQHRAAKRLDEVYISSRYPNGLISGTPGQFYEAKDGEECRALARGIIDFVKKQSGT